MIIPAHHDSDCTDLLLRLIGEDPAAGREVLAQASTSDDVPLLVAAAVLSGQHTHLERAAEHSRTSRDRQLVAVAGAHLRGDADLFGALVREHLIDHPNSLLASWIAGAAHRTHPHQDQELQP